MNSFTSSTIRLTRSSHTFNIFGSLQQHCGELLYRGLKTTEERGISVHFFCKGNNIPRTNAAKVASQPIKKEKNRGMYILKIYIRKQFLCRIIAEGKKGQSKSRGLNIFY